MISTVLNLFQISIVFGGDGGDYRRHLRTDVHEQKLLSEKKNPKREAPGDIHEIAYNLRTIGLLRCV